MTHRILFVTGTRADFGKLEPLAAAARDAGMAVSFFVTGMHLMDRYGRTKLEVGRFEGADVFEFQNQREGDPQDMILAKTVIGFSDFLTEHRPDLAVVHGDRIEALASLKRRCSVIVYTDSQYVKNGITTWIHGWKARGWTTADKKPVKNAELWRRLDELNAGHEVQWRWVRGHDGDPGNERADRLANKGCDSLV